MQILDGVETITHIVGRDNEIYRRLGGGMSAATGRIAARAHGKDHPFMVECHEGLGVPMHDCHEVPPSPEGRALIRRVVSLYDFIRPIEPSVEKWLSTFLARFLRIDAKFCT